MITKTRVTDERIARFLQVGYVLEAIVEGRCSEHHDHLPMDQPSTSLTRNLLAEAQSESRRHREQIASILEELNKKSPPLETVSTRIETNYERTYDKIEAVLYDQLCSEFSAFQYYDSVHEWLVKDRSCLDLSISPDKVITIVKDIRQEEQEGVYDVLDAIESMDVQATTYTPIAQI